MLDLTETNVYIDILGMYKIVNRVVHVYITSYPAYRFPSCSTFPIILRVPAF